MHCRGYCLLWRLWCLIWPRTPGTARPWQVPTASVFQSGWYSAPEQWQSMPDAEQKALRALKLIRSAFHNALGADMQANFENAWVELVL